MHEAVTMPPFESSSQRYSSPEQAISRQAEHSHHTALAPPFPRLAEFCSNYFVFCRRSELKDRELAKNLAH